MKIKVEEIVNGIQRYHACLADYYFEQKRSNHDKRVRDLLEYIGNSELYQEQNIASLKHTVSRDQLEKILTLPDYPLGRIVSGESCEDQHKDSISYDEVLKKALQGDVVLKKACRILSENAPDPGLKALFSNICKDADREIKNLFSYINLFAC